jgi:hypothetical protein
MQETPFGRFLGAAIVGCLWQAADAVDVSLVKKAERHSDWTAVGKQGDTSMFELASFGQ